MALAAETETGQGELSKRDIAKSPASRYQRDRRSSQREAEEQRSQTHHVVAMSCAWQRRERASDQRDGHGRNSCADQKSGLGKQRWRHQEDLSTNEGGEA